MIASYELDMAYAMERADESIAPSEGQVASLGDLSASSGLIYANDTIGNAMVSEARLTPLLPPSEEPEAAPTAPAPTVSSDVIEERKPEVDKVAATALPAPDEISTSNLLPPVENEAMECEAASLGDTPDLTSESDATHDPAKLVPPNPDGDIDAGAAATEIASANANLTPAKVETMTNPKNEALTPSHSENEACVSVVEDDDVVPAAQAHEPHAEPATPALPEPAAEDTLDMGEAAALAMPMSDPAPAYAVLSPPVESEATSALEGAAPAQAHDDSAASMMIPVPVEDSTVPLAQASLPPETKPELANAMAMVVTPSPAVVPAANHAFAMALKFAHCGMGVFPLYGFNGSDCACGKPEDSPYCKPGKHPRQLASFKGASTSSATITSWFTHFGPVNYGIATGLPVGNTGKMLVVVDIDWYKPETRQTVEDLNQADFLFPDTAEVLTGGGGRHLYYLAEVGTKFAAKLGTGIDFKGIGGYVVGPGCMHKSGKRYEFETSSDLFEGQEIADLPQWVYDNFSKAVVAEASAAPLGASLAPCVDDVSDAEMAEYKAYLELISPLDYDTWVNVLMALKSRSESDQMFGLADWWSQKAGYKGVEAVRATWKSIKAQGGITIKTLKRLADAVRAEGVDISRLLIEPARQPIDDEWPAPEPIATIDPARAYPLDALPMIMQEAVKEVRDYAMAPMALVACSALSSLSLAAQGLYDVQRDVGLTGPISLYMLAIAESGERKSTLDTFFIKPAREFEVACAVAAAPELLKFNTDLMAWEAKKKGILDQITKLASNDKDTSVAEKSLAAHTAAQPFAPVIPRVIYSDATPEALTRGLASEWPSGGVISSEGGAVFGGHGMNKESQMRNLAVLNELWDGKPIRIDRRTSASYTVNGARLTVAVQVQPATLDAFMEGSGPLARGSGFIARFLTCFPESTQGTRAYKKSPPNWPKLDPFRHRIAELFATKPVIEDGALKPTMLYLADEAMSVWIDFYNAIEVQLGNGGDLRNVRDVASKTADNAARIAALFHVLEDEAGPISETCMRSGARVAKWHLNESQRVFAGGIASAGKSDAQKLEDWLLAYCQDHGVAEVSVKTVSQRGPAAFRKKPAHTPVLEKLERLGRVKVSGAPARTVYLNPTLLN